MSETGHGEWYLRFRVAPYDTLSPLCCHPLRCVEQAFEEVRTGVRMMAVFFKANIKHRKVGIEVSGVPLPIRDPARGGFRLLKTV